MNGSDPTLEDSSLQGLPVKLDIFEGPLDLLLHLIRENKVEISDIPISSITEQYLKYLDLMKTLNLDVAGEFLVMAATLMHIKSRMLLPFDEESEGTEEGEDPRQELVRQLLEYQQFKEASLTLGELEEARRLTFAPQSIGPEPPKRTEYPLEVSLFDLLSALEKLLESLPEEKHVDIKRDHLSVAERISEVLEFLREAEGEVPFEDLFRGSGRVGEVVVTLLALLELMRLRMARAWQAVPGGSIMVTDIRPDDAEVRADEEAEAGPPESPGDEETDEGNGEESADRSEGPGEPAT